MTRWFDCSILLPMRVLVACPDCTRQFDAGGLAEGSRFRCLCGSVLRVHRPRPHDAAVVRCSSCGAPREGQSRSCHFCGADFTLHEKDLHTICPGCLTRVSDQARFCHHCASPLLPAGAAGEPTEHRCPVCSHGKKLTSRRIGEPSIGILECPTCAGLWLAGDEFELLLQRTRATSASSESEVVSDPHDYQSRRRVTQDGPLYRACPQCGKLMHRRNFGRKSGVIVDQCSGHGTWFDDEELESILRWIQRGGERRVARLDEEERQAAARHAQMKRQLDAADADWQPPASRAGTLVELFGWLASRVR